MGFEYEADARRFLAELKERLDKFGLTLNEDKTRLIRFGRFAVQDCKARGQGKPETFDFLGFTHYCGKAANGLFEVKRLTIKKRMRATLKAIGQALLRRRHQSIRVVGMWLRQVVRGYYAYFNVPGNEARMEEFRSQVCRYWMHALRRRSQRHRMTWARFKRIACRFIPYVREVPKHPFPWHHLNVMTQGRSRMR